MIPPGVHYIYFSVADKYGSVGMRNGFFHDFKLKEVVAKKWNKQAEAIEDYTLDEGQLESFEENKRDFDRFLGAYPFEEYKRWISLTNNINQEFLERLIPGNKIISSGSTLVGKTFSKSKTSESTEAKSEKEKDSLFKIPANLTEAESRLPQMEHEVNTNIRFSKIPEEVFPKGSDAKEMTKHSIDMSYRLEQLIQKQRELDIEKPDPLNVLGELQFAFICFLVGHVYDAFEQWKNLIHLLCNCESFIRKEPNLFVQFIQVIYFQLKEMPEDFFTDIITSQNFLVVNLHNFFDNIKDIVSDQSIIEDMELMKKLDQKCEQFKNYLQEKFQFDFDLEPDEYAPVICEDA